MEEEELSQYFNDKRFVFQILHTYVDYDDVDNPVKTIPGKVWVIKVVSGAVKFV